MSFITTQVTQMNRGVSHFFKQPIGTKGHSAEIDPSSTLGYGLGKLLRRAFDQFANTWQKMWALAPSEEALSAK